MAERRIPHYKPVGGHVAPLPVVNPVANTGVSEGLFAAGRMLHELGVRLGQSGPAAKEAKRDTAGQSAMVRYAGNQIPLLRMQALNEGWSEARTVKELEKLRGETLERLTQTGLPDLGIEGTLDGIGVTEVNELFRGEMLTDMEAAAENAALIARETATTTLRGSVDEIAGRAPSLADFNKEWGEVLAGFRGEVAHSGEMLKLANKIDEEANADRTVLAGADKKAQAERKALSDEAGRQTQTAMAVKYGEMIGSADGVESGVAEGLMVEAIAESAALYGAQFAAGLAQTSAKEAFRKKMHRAKEDGGYTQYYASLLSGEGLSSQDDALMSWLGVSRDDVLRELDAGIDLRFGDEQRDANEALETLRNLQSDNALDAYQQAADGTLSRDVLDDMLAGKSITKEQHGWIEGRIGRQEGITNDTRHGEILLAIHTDDSASRQELQDMVMRNMAMLSPDDESGLFNAINARFERDEALRAAGKDEAFRRAKEQLNRATHGDDLMHIWKQDMIMAKFQAFRTFYRLVDEGLDPDEAMVRALDPFLATQTQSLYKEHSLVPKHLLEHYDDGTINYSASILKLPGKVPADEVLGYAEEIERLEILWYSLPGNIYGPPSPPTSIGAGQ